MQTPSLTKSSHGVEHYRIKSSYLLLIVIYKCYIFTRSSSVTRARVTVCRQRSNVEAVSEQSEQCSDEGSSEYCCWRSWDRPTPLLLAGNSCPPLQTCPPELRLARQGPLASSSLPTLVCRQPRVCTHCALN